LPAESKSDSGQRGLTGRQDQNQKQIKIKIKSRRRSTSRSNAAMVGAALISVGAAEGCEGGYRFAAFGSSYRDLRTPSVLCEFIRECGCTADASPHRMYWPFANEFAPTD